MLCLFVYLRKQNFPNFLKKSVTIIGILVISKIKNRYDNLPHTHIWYIGENTSPPPHILMSLSCDKCNNYIPSSSILLLNKVVRHRPTLMISLIIGIYQNFVATLRKRVRVPDWMSWNMHHNSWVTKYYEREKFSF